MIPDKPRQLEVELLSSIILGNEPWSLSNWTRNIAKETEMEHLSSKIYSWVRPSFHMPKALVWIISVQSSWAIQVKQHCRILHWMLSIILSVCFKDWAMHQLRNSWVQSLSSKNSFQKHKSLEDSRFWISLITCRMKTDQNGMNKHLNHSKHHSDWDFPQIV